mgnify:FL=1
MSDFSPFYKITFEMTCPSTGQIYYRTLDEADDHDEAINLVLDVVDGRHKDIEKYAKPHIFSAAYFPKYDEEMPRTNILKGDVKRALLNKQKQTIRE